MQKKFLEIFHSQTVVLDLSQIGISKVKESDNFESYKKNFNDAVEISFLCMVNTLLKLCLQKMSSAMCHC